MSSLVLPICRSILLADRIITESGTNKKTLVGVYSIIQANSVPATRKIHLYLELCDAEGKYDFGLEIVNLQTNVTAASGRIENVYIEDRLTPMEMVLSLDVSFDKYGAYEARLQHFSKHIATKTFMVVESKSALHAV